MRSRVLCRGGSASILGSILASARVLQRVTASISTSCGSESSTFGAQPSLGKKDAGFLPASAHFRAGVPCFVEHYVCNGAQASLGKRTAGFRPASAQLRAGVPFVVEHNVCGGRQASNITYRAVSTVTKGALTDREVKVTNFANEDKGNAVLSGDVFDVPIRRDIVHRVVVWQLAKRRQGTHSTLTISEVSGTGRKPGPQKGSGNARHGTLRGPQFRGGANVFGPKPRNYEQGLQKKVRRLGLKVALSARLAEGKLLVFDNIVPPSPKTKDMVQILGNMEKVKKVLFVEESEKVNEYLCRATRNIHYANVIPVKGLNVYSILQHDTLVMTLSAIRALEDRLHTPINR